jgi:hypothetical protein
LRISKHSHFASVRNTSKAEQQTSQIFDRAF